MNKQKHKDKDEGYVDGLTGFEPRKRYNSCYMDGWYEGREAVLEEAADCDVVIMSDQDYQNEIRLANWRKKWTEVKLQED